MIGLILLLTVAIAFGGAGSPPINAVLGWAVQAEGQGVSPVIAAATMAVGIFALHRAFQLGRPAVPVFVQKLRARVSTK